MKKALVFGLAVLVCTMGVRAGDDRDECDERRCRDLSVYELRPMDFGKLLPATRRPTLRLLPSSGSEYRTQGVTVLLPPTSALYEVRGEPNRKFVVLLDRQSKLSGGSRLIKAKIRQFYVSHGDYGLLDQQGRAQFYVGAELELGNLKGDGPLRGDYSITVEYL